jgi:hypothetical protein
VEREAGAGAVDHPEPEGVAGVRTEEAAQSDPQEIGHALASQAAGGVGEMVARGGPAGAAARSGRIGRPVTGVPARGDNRVGDIHRARSAGVLAKLLSRYAPLGLLGFLLVAEIHTEHAPS